MEFTLRMLQDVNDSTNSARCDMHARCHGFKEGGKSYLADAEGNGNKQSVDAESSETIHSVDAETGEVEDDEEAHRDNPIGTPPSADSSKKIHSGDAETGDAEDDEKRTETLPLVLV